MSNTQCAIYFKKHLNYLNYLKTELFNNNKTKIKK